MKKKIITSVLALCLCAGGFAAAKHYVKVQEPMNIETISDTLEDEGKPSDKEKKKGLDLAVKGAVLMDADTGTVIYKENAHKELPPASVTKIMTMLLTLEECEKGRITLTDKVTISERAASMGGSQMYMESGETHTVDELLEGIAMVSANDACVAIAEYVYGSEEIFVEHMNKRAEELGMSDTHFVNTNGLPVTDHLTSAYDIAVMSRELLKHQETQKWLNKWQSTITVGLPGKETEFGLTNTNKLIKQYPGANGIKTGFTQEAGFCLSGSATKNDTTLIAVVLGCKSSKSRFEEISKLLNYGFANYSSKTIASEGQKMEKVELIRGNPFSINAVCKRRAVAFVKKGDEGRVSYKTFIDKKISLPLKKGEDIGHLTIYRDKREIAVYPLVSDSNVKKISFITYYIRKIKKLF